MVEVPDSTTRYIQSDTGKPTKDLFNWMKDISARVGSGGGSTDWVFVTDFGAKGDGVTDDTAAIQAAINSLPLWGGTVIFPPGATGIYIITSTLTIGNGTNAVVSTRHGVRLISQSMTIAGLFAGYPIAGAILRWNGAALGTMLQVNGPLQGWEISNLAFDGINGTSSPGLCVGLVSAQFGRMDNVTMAGGSGACLLTTTQPSFPGGVNVDSLHNTFTNLNIITPDIASAIGILLNAGNPSSPSSDSDYSTFIGTIISVGSGAHSGKVGIDVRGADSNFFFNTHMICSGAGNFGVVFDYSSNNSFPSNTKFYGVDNASFSGSTPWANNGSPAAGIGILNEIYSLVTANGGVVPNNVPGLAYTGGIQIGLNASGIGIGGSVTQITSITTSVTLNKMCGQVTTVSNAYTAGVPIAFTFFNSFLGANDTMIVSQNDSAGVSGFNVIAVRIVAGHCSIGIIPFGNVTEVVSFNFQIVKGVNT